MGSQFWPEAEPVDEEPDTVYGDSQGTARKLHSTTDASVWVEEFMGFMRRLGRDLEGTMLGWFANAIETGRTAGQRMAEPEPLSPDGKYVVMKAEEFWRFLGAVGLPPAWGTDIRGNTIGEDLDCAVLVERMRELARQYWIEDAVVIRRQDVFAAPALDAYANAITVAIEMAKATNMPTRTDRDRLVALADFFHEQARLSWDTDRKIPD